MFYQHGKGLRGKIATGRAAAFDLEFAGCGHGNHRIFDALVSKGIMESDDAVDAGLAVES